jgi:2-polyprenyl-3-methyl-5-hydroxy-6-metoxy-1,4-benzoquinol methylase
MSIHSSIDELVYNPLEPVIQIMGRHGATCTPEEFHAAVNVTFHKFEAEIYDEIHRDMWESLPVQFALLAQDCAGSVEPDRKLAVLDIGCGTGLASDSILKSSLGPQIASIDLSDTCQAMLQQAAKRAQGWKIATHTFEGTVESLAADGKYDLIITCSVLHHVPDLPSFLRNVQRLQKSDGVFLHLQDPNGDYLKDPELLRRTAQVKKPIPDWAARFAPGRVLGRLKRELTGRQHEDYLSHTNQELLANGFVKSPLSIAEIFAITDIHVQDGAGISIHEMRRWMPGYEMVSQRAYGFFGQLGSTLPPTFASLEAELIQKRALNGVHVGAAWKRKAA